MAKSKNKKVEVQGAGISIIEKEEEDYISLSDRFKNFDGGSAHIEQWLRNKDTFEFGSWLSPEFKLYLIKEFQRLKTEEQEKLSNEWNLHRTLAKVNYRIHTDAIKEHIIPPKVTKKQQGLIYASEADLLNMAMFGMTDKTWREQNPDKDGNIRDHSTLEQLLVLANLESLNAEFIRMGLQSGERLKKLNTTAIRQMKSLTSSKPVKQIQPKK